jgi:hypothetical protein
MIPDCDLRLDLSVDNDNAVDKPEEACGVGFMPQGKM